MPHAPSPATLRRDRNRREMREMILSAARNILVDCGVSALSMRAVARDIGYSPASLYEYFPSKAALCRALFFEGASGLSGKIRSAFDASGDGAPSSEIARALGVAYREFALDNRELYLLVFSNPVAGFVPDEHDREAASGGYDLLVEAMRSGVQSGTMRDLDPDVAALTSWSVVHGFVMLEILGFVGGDDREQNDGIFNAVLDHVSYWHHPTSDPSGPSSAT
jgi:AcrR family transcriptional regulator